MSDLGKPGNGKRFAKLTSSLEKKGESGHEAQAVAAIAGRKKYGAGKMASWAAHARSK